MNYEAFLCDTCTEQMDRNVYHTDTTSIDAVVERDGKYFCYLGTYLGTDLFCIKNITPSAVYDDLESALAYCIACEKM